MQAELRDECLQAGCEVRTAAQCTDVEDAPQGVRVKVKSDSTSEVLQTKRVVLADGAFSSLIEKLGFNKNRLAGGPTLKCLSYVLDRIDSPFPQSRYIELCAPSVHPGQVNMGLWANNSFHIGVGTAAFTQIKLSDVLDRVMQDSPFASWFAHSKVIDKLGCNISLRTPIWEPARGNVICCGDNAAFAETAIKGAFGCGYKAAKAVKLSLEGGDGSRLYNDFWQRAFYFHSEQYLSISKAVYPVARVLTDGEVDTLYRWLQDNQLWGLPNDLLLDNAKRLKQDLPEIAEKVLAG
jgi:flavin-dependent dehydrogenase